MGVGQHTCLQVDVLGLGSIIIREDMFQGGGAFGVLPPGCHFAVCHGPGNRAPPGLIPASLSALFRQPRCSG